jgi:hypothetical protein
VQVSKYAHKNQTISQETEKLTSELTVDKKSLSTTRRKKVSARDNRPSAQACGVVGIVVMVSVAALIIIPDVASLLKAVTQWNGGGKRDITGTNTLKPAKGDNSIAMKKLKTMAESPSRHKRKSQ